MAAPHLRPASLDGKRPLVVVVSENLQGEAKEAAELARINSRIADGMHLEDVFIIRALGHLKQKEAFEVSELKEILQSDGVFIKSGQIYNSLKSRLAKDGLVKQTSQKVHDYAIASVRRKIEIATNALMRTGALETELANLLERQQSDSNRTLFQVTERGKEILKSGICGLRIESENPLEIATFKDDIKGRTLSKFDEVHAYTLSRLAFLQVNDNRGARGIDVARLAAEENKEIDRNLGLIRMERKIPDYSRKAGNAIVQLFDMGLIKPSSFYAVGETGRRFTLTEFGIEKVKKDYLNGENLDSLLNNVTQNSLPKWPHPSRK